MCNPTGGTGGPIHPNTAVPPLTTATNQETTPTDAAACPPVILPSECQLLNNCSGFLCSSNYATALLVVEKCSDPLRVDLSISGRDSTDNLLETVFFVGGPDITYYREKGFTIQTNRNATHLNISVSCDLFCRAMIMPQCVRK